MRQNYFYLGRTIGILALALLPSCQDSQFPGELVHIEELSYSPQAQTTLLTARHPGGCTNSKYDYQYQILESNTADKSIIFGLFVDTGKKCQQQDLQFIKLPLPQTIFPPEKLIFTSSGNKEIIVMPAAQRIPKTSTSQLKPQQQIAKIEDVNYDPKTKIVSLKIYLENVYGADISYDYSVLDKDAASKTATLALTANISQKGDLDEYALVKMPLPELSFKPDKLIFPISATQKIVLKI